MSNMNTTNTSAPLYLAFAAALHAEIKALGLPSPTLASTPTGFPENENFFFVEWGAHGQAPALIVPKSKTRMGTIDSHLDLSGASGHIALPKKNGRVICKFEPDISKVSKVLAQFVGASKRPVAAPVRRLVSASATPPVATTQTPPSIREGSEADLYAGLPPAPTPGEIEAASWAATGYSDDEAEEALKSL